MKMPKNTSNELRLSVHGIGGPLPLSSGDPLRVLHYASLQCIYGRPAWEALYGLRAKAAETRPRDHARLSGTGSVFHLFSRLVYGPIEKDNVRNRRWHSFDYIRARLVQMDFLLENQAHDFLETESDKLNLFCESLAIPKDVLPAKVYEGGPGSDPTVRYFVDKFPLFLAPPISGASPVVTFGFVDSGAGSLWSFGAHLGAYEGLFRHLKSFRLLYIARRATEFRRAEDRFRARVKQPLESDVSAESCATSRFAGSGKDTNTLCR